MSLDFAKKDFADLVSQLRDRVREKDEWKDAYASSTGETLIELFAYVAELLMYYIERRAQESYLSTANLRSSILHLVRLINYKPRRNVSSKGDLRFSVPTAHTVNIIIPRGTRVSSGAMEFKTEAESIIFPHITSVDIAGYQGKMITKSFTSNGLINQFYDIFDVKVENTRVEVFVSDIKWEEVSSFVLSKSDSLHYVIDYNIDSTITVKFSDGVFGKIPPNGVPIRIEYIQSEGTAGNVFSHGLINTILDTIFDANNNPVTDISVSNITNFLGGDDAEDKDEIRDEAPRVFTTGDRAVTKADYMAILDNYPGVVTSNVWGEHEEDPPVSSLFNVVRMSILLQDWGVPDAAFRTILGDFLKTKAQITVKYEFINPLIIRVHVVCNPRVKRAFSLSEVESAVRSEITSQFSLGRIKIGTPVRYSDVSRAIDLVPGVDFHHIEFRLQHIIGTGDGTTTTFNATLSVPPIRERYVRVYEEDVLVAIDNGTGGLVEQGASGVTGTIVYDNGVISVAYLVGAPPASGRVISAEYRQIPSVEEENDIVLVRHEIVKLGKITVTPQYV